MSNFWKAIKSTVVPRITTLIRSSEIAVEWKRRNAKIKSSLKRIKTHLMHSNGLETHSPVKILHRAAIFSACAVRNPSQKTAGSHFIYPVAILKPPISWRKIVILWRIGSRSREPIIAMRKKPIQTIILRSQLWLQKDRCNAVSS